MPFGYTFEQIDVFFKISAYDGFLQNNEPDKCDEVAFYPLERLPDETAPFIRHALSKIQMGEFYSEFGWE